MPSAWRSKRAGWFGKELIMSNERLNFYADFNELGKDANPEMLVLQKVIKA
jgi:hypothetical protein